MPLNWYSSSSATTLSDDHTHRIDRLPGLLWQVIAAIVVLIGAQ